LFFILTFLLLNPLLLPAQSDVTGFWLLRVPTGDGNYRETFLDLKQVGETVTGKVLQGFRDLPISEGTFKGGKLHLVVTYRSQSQEQRRVTYDGTVEGGKISMTVLFPGREAEAGTAERSKPEAALPPPRLPLPELHDVPGNGLARTPPMGWNSWNKFAGKIDDATVRGVADAMVSSGMRDAGYIFLNIDDTWQGRRDAQGNITTNGKFPDMKALADYVHSKDLRIGIYSSPGPKTCAGYEGSYGHEEQDAKTYAAWDMDYLKYDWCGAARIYKDEEMQAVYQKMGDALRRTGRPIVYSLCQYGRADVWKWGTKVSGNLWRTTGDIRDNWEAMSNIGFNQFALAPFAGPGHWNDPDMLEIGNGGMTNDEYRTHMSLWALLAAPLLAGNDLRTMSEQTKSILLNRDVIAVNQDPLGAQSRRVWQQEPYEVWMKPLADGGRAIGLFNRGEDTHRISASFRDLGISSGRVSVRDLWQGSSSRLDNATVFSADVRTHGVVLVIIHLEAASESTHVAPGEKGLHGQEIIAREQLVLKL
jgi:alpha-galactosidase